MLPLRWSTTDAVIGGITATGAAMIAVARTIMTKVTVGADIESQRDRVLGHCAVVRRAMPGMWERAVHRSVTDLGYWPAYQGARSKSSHQPPRPLPMADNRSTSSMRSTYLAFL
jgi:hypothetical protein